MLVEVDIKKRDVKEVVNDVKKLESDLEDGVKKVITSSGVGEDNTVTENYDTKSADVTKMLDGEDPWLSRKNQ